jgi:hypothetical protein
VSDVTPLFLSRIAVPAVRKAVICIPDGPLPFPILFTFFEQRRCNARTLWSRFPFSSYYAVAQACLTFTASHFMLI